MKTLTLLTMLLIANLAHAGAYTFSCTNALGTLTIDKSSISVSEGYFTDASMMHTSQAATAVELKTRTLGSMFGREKLENPSTAISVEVAGKSSVLSKRNYKDECGNVGEKTSFAATVVVKSLGTRQTIKDTVICFESMISGHCY